MPSSAAELAPAEAQLYAAAKPEREVTWYTGQYAAEIAQEVAAAFGARYPGLKVNVTRAAGQVAFQRVAQDIKAGVRNCDVLSATDLGHLLYLKEKGLLRPFHPANEARLLEPLRKIDPDGAYNTTVATTIVIAYNTEKVAAADVPHRWTDLLDPKWKRQVGLGHPGYSGSQGGWAVMMRKLYGWTHFEKLAKNEPLIGRSIIDTGTMVTSGERMLGVSTLATALRLGARGNPIAVVYPEDGVVLQVSASGILKEAPHPNAAMLFVEFLMSIDVAEIAARAYYEPIRPEVSLPPPARSMRDTNTIQPTVAEIVAGIPEVKEQWRETFGN